VGRAKRVKSCTGITKVHTGITKVHSVKIFVSSLIGGMDTVRGAAKEAITQLDHEPVMAEDFRAQPRSSQVACLDGVRQSAAVVLILGSWYGTKQPSGLSATHEEYREARDSRPVFVFVESSSAREPGQEEFIREVEAWNAGFFREGFATPDEPRSKLIRALHRWEISKAAAPLELDALLERAKAHVPRDGTGQHTTGPMLALAIAGGPLQAVLRPSALDDPSLVREIQKAALFGDSPIFDSTSGTQSRVDHDALLVEQEEGGSIRVDTAGTLVAKTPLTKKDPRDGHSSRGCSGRIGVLAVILGLALRQN
jgi:hypothetical protein